MMMKKIIILTLAAVLTLAASAAEYDFWSGSLAYKINDDGKSVSVWAIDDEENENYNGFSDAIIPEAVSNKGKTYTVIGIGPYAFYRCEDIELVSMPNTITTIGNYAFGLCSGLKSAYLPKSVKTIGADAFYECSSLLFIEIPSGVTYIDRYAFWGCEGLVGVTSHIRKFEGVSISSDIFGTPDIDVFKTATLYVPRGMISAYRARAPWSYFQHIEEFDDAIAGDVNGDSKVDVEDVNAIINIILESKTEADYPGNGDLNGDNKIDVEDVNAVINIILAN